MLGHFSAWPRFFHAKKPRAVNRKTITPERFHFQENLKKKWFSGAQRAH
jgi:hypothetical protein